MSNKTLTYVEIDYDWCPLTFGESPCSAALGGDTTAKCWNTRATCQSPDDFQRTMKTLRFVKPTGYEPIDISAIASVQSVSTSSAKIRPGEDLGERASVDVTFFDHPYHDRPVDKYWRERVSGEAQADGVGYRPQDVGTFWGKFRARFPYYRTRGLRIIQGTLGQSLDEMETRHYVMDSIAGPTANGTFRITAKDVLKLADDDKAQAPVASRGTLARDIEEADTEIRLTPTDVGSEYPSTGIVTIGNEICVYERDGDIMTLTRGQRGTNAESHSEGDTAQLAIDYDSMLSGDIIRDLLVNYADVPSRFIPINDWQFQDREYITRVFGALITEPTSVSELIGQLCEQVGIIVWWDEVQQLIRYRAIRQPTDAPMVLNDNTDFLSGSIGVKEQPKKRVSQVWVYYGVIDPTEKVDEARNYRSVYKRVETGAESADQYDKPQIKKIYARWISRFNRPAAVQMAQRIASSNVNPPRLFSASMPWDKQGVDLGMTYDVMTRVIQTASGRAANTRVLITSYQRSLEQIQIQAEEFLYEDPPDVELREVIVDADTLSMNLRTAHDNIYVFVQPGDDVQLHIVEGVILGSENSETPALTIGDWPDGVNIRVVIEGRIQGCGGDGGRGVGTGVTNPGEDGGSAIYTRYPINIDSAGELWSGGGGGGGGRATEQANSRGGGGGGGAGFLPGDTAGGGTPGTGTQATTETAGTGQKSINTNGDEGFGGDGGAPGEPGQDGRDGGGNAGSAGSAVDGLSYVNYTTRGDIRGGEIN